MGFPTDRLFLTNRESRVKAREWASFIWEEVDRLKEAGIPVRSAYFKREDFGLRLMPDPANCIRRGVVKIPGEVDPQRVKDISHCFFPEGVRTDTNYDADVEYQVLVGKPVGIGAAEIPGETKNKFEIHYEMGKYPKMMDACGIGAKLVDRVFVPSYVRIR